MSHVRITFSVWNLVAKILERRALRSGVNRGLSQGVKLVEMNPLATALVNTKKKSWEMKVNVDVKPENTPKNTKTQPTENQNNTKTEI